MSRLVLALALLGLTGCAALRSLVPDPEVSLPWDCGDSATASATSPAGESPGETGQSSSSSPP